MNALGPWHGLKMLVGKALDACGKASDACKNSILGGLYHWVVAGNSNIPPSPTVFTLTFKVDCGRLKVEPNAGKHPLKLDGEVPEFSIDFGGVATVPELQSSIQELHESMKQLKAASIENMVGIKELREMVKSSNSNIGGNMDELRREMKIMKDTIEEMESRNKSKK